MEGTDHPDSGDPRAELALLADALRAHLGRLERSGHRRLPASARRPAAAQPAPARVESPPRVEDPPPRAPEPTAAPPPRTRAPRREAPPPRQPASRPTAGPQPAHTRPVGAAPPFTFSSGSIGAESEALRARAAACPDLAGLAGEVAACTACSLARTRKQTVFSDGRARIPLMFVGEAPGANEDEQGLPFVGAAGEMLNGIITKGMGLAREDVYIANILKCRPPGNRDPSADEKQLCTGWLDRQIELVDPRVIVPLGRHAACHVLRTDAPMSRLRGKVHELGGRQVVPTYHPAFLLRSPSMKGACWADIQIAMRLLDLPLPPPRGGDSSPSR